MLYDDFILEGFPDLRRISETIAFLELDPRSAVAYLINTSLPTEGAGQNGCLKRVKDFVDYKLNSAPGIWRRRALMDYVGNQDNPWAWEVFGSYRTYGDGRGFYTLDVCCSDMYPYNYKKGGAVYRGKWVKEVVSEKIAKYQLTIDTNIRGFSNEVFYEPRTLIWKINFMFIGYKMVGLRSLRFVTRYISEKFNVKK
jgi:hypothetical protein